MLCARASRIARSTARALAASEYMHVRVSLSVTNLQRNCIDREFSVTERGICMYAHARIQYIQ